MSQQGPLNGNGGGGGIIQIINGDIGSVTGPIVTIYANNAVNNSGSSLLFDNSGSISTLNVTDANFNTLIGNGCGNLGAVGDGGSVNTGLGYLALSTLTSGQSNVCIGALSGSALTDGMSNTCLGTNSLANATVDTNNNTAIGFGSLQGLTDGDNNVCLGINSGLNFSGSESNNIIIGNQGTIADANAIRIGTQGSGVQQQNICFIAGIVGVTVANQQSVVVNSATGQLGVSSGSFATNYTNVTFAMSPYTVLVTDQYISCDTSGGAITLNFPNAPTANRTWVVKDRTGNSAVNNVTITTPGGTVTFDGGTTLLMNTAYAAFNLLANSTPTYEVY